jgi:hypothetical protein
MSCAVRVVAAADSTSGAQSGSSAGLDFGAALRAMYAHYGFSMTHREALWTHFVAGPVQTATPQLAGNWDMMAGIGDLQTQIYEATRGLRALTFQIQSDSSPEVPTDIRILAERAVVRLRERENENIDEWAKRLARDIGDAHD